MKHLRSSKEIKSDLIKPRESTISLINKEYDLVLVCYRSYRYPGCTTRMSVPSQPTLQKKEKKVRLIKEKIEIQIKNLLRTPTKKKLEK